MPRPGLPLTPGSSSDIQGKDGTQQLASFQLSFELPPPAIHDASRTSPTIPSQVSPTDTKSRQVGTTSPGTTYPMQPAEAVKARRRSSAARDGKDNSFALPPPPTRSRKIIQMKPRQEGSGGISNKEKAKTTGKSNTAAKTTTPAANSKAAAVPTGEAVTDDKSKKKQPSATSAAGRKIARKTAHSLIERRRRSKMNEEFAVLKGMIPACTGDMHKLSILQVCV